MQDTCLMAPYVKNSKGEIVESELFNGLLSLFSGNRGEAWRHYKRATDETFLSKNAPGIKLGETGEITLKEYAEIVALSETNDFPSIQALNQELQSGTYSYQQAIEKVAKFNSEQALDSKYMATVRDTKKAGEYEILVVENTALERDSLRTFIKGNTLRGKLINFLASNGISVSFIEQDYSRYSTENAITNMNGLYQLIEFSKTGKDIELAEEAGHFVIGAMGDSPLVKRLENIFQDQEARYKVLGKEAHTRNLGKNPAREVAGIVVGKVLARQLNEDSVFTKLVHRIVMAARKLFAKIAASEVRKAIIEAEEIAQQFVDEFTTNPLSDRAQKALETVETMYHQNKNTRDKALDTIIKELTNLAKEMGVFNEAMQHSIENIVSEAGLSTATYGVSTIEGILSAITGLADFADKYLLSPEKRSEAISLAGLPPLELASALKRKSEDVVLFTYFSQRISDILSILDHLEEVEKEQLKTRGQESLHGRMFNYHESLSILKSTVNKGINGESYRDKYLADARTIAIAFLQQIYGAEFVSYQGGILWDYDHGQGLRDEKLPLSKIVDNVINDDPLLKAWCGSLVNSKDIGAQLIAKAIKEANHVAYQMIGDAHSELMALDNEAKKNGINYKKFYTTDEQGKLTGHLVQLVPEDYIDSFGGTYEPTLVNGNLTFYEFDYHKYYTAKHDFIAKLYKEFIDSEKGKQIAGAKAEVKRLHFREWSKDKMRKFHAQNSVKQEQEDGSIKYIPNQNFIKYSKLTKEEVAWYKKYQQAFSTYKSWIGGEKKMLESLAPQVRGSALNTIGNIRKFEKKGYITGAFRAIWRKAVEFICTEHIDVNAESHGNWNTEGLSDEEIIENYFKDFDNIEVERSRLLPLYYTSKLKDTARLDTDLIAATIHFATMAAKYHASSYIQSSLEVTKDVLTDREQEYKEFKTKTGASLFKAREKVRNSIRKHGTTVADSIEEYVSSLYYGMNYGVLTSVLSNSALQKILPLAGKAMVLWYLGNNKISAAINLLTGNTEIFKEAVVGEEFNLADWAWAVSKYTINAPHLLFDIAAQDDTAKINLFNIKFQATDKTELRYTQWRHWSERVLNAVNPTNILMCGYSAGEHFMQNIPYMAMAHGTTLYAYDGSKTNLWDAYTVVKEDYQYTDSKGKIRTTKGAAQLKLSAPHFRRKEDIATYKKVRNDIDTISKASTFKTDLLSAEIYDILKTKEKFSDTRLSQMNKSQILDVLNSLSESLTFNANDEAIFSTKAREVTNRMHGVYNKMDKTMFHRSLLGMLLLPFKGYAFGMLTRRWSGNKYSTILDKEDEGSHITALKMATGSVKEIASFAKEILHTAIGDTQKTRLDLFKAAISHLGHAGGIWAAMCMPKNNLRGKLQNIVSVSDTNINNVRRAVLDTAFIVGFMTLVSLAFAMATGSEDDEEIDEMTLDQLYKYCQENGIELDSTGKSENPYSINVNKKYLNTTIKRRLSSEGYTKGHPDRRKEARKLLVKYMRDKIKEVNKTKAEDTRPWWNLTYYMANRLYREQAAFNTVSGFKLEGTSLFDIMPLSVNAILDIYKTCSSVVKSNNFYDGTISVAGQTYTVDYAVELVNNPKTNPKAKKLIARALTERWEKLYYDVPMKDYLYDKAKKGHHKRFDPKYKTTLQMKYDFGRREQYIMHNGDQATRDYNFGTRQ